MARRQHYRRAGETGRNAGVGTHEVPLFTPRFVPLTRTDDYLNSQTAKLYHMAGKVHAGMGQLQEYHLVLIAGAVTGKIDVRKDALV